MVSGRKTTKNRSMEEKDTSNPEMAPHETGANADTNASDGYASGTGTPTDPFTTGSRQTPPPPASGFFDRLRDSSWKRIEANKVAGGVCAGLAEKWGIDPVIVRGITVVLMLFMGLGMLAYALAWLLLPEKTTGRTLFEDVRYGQAQAVMIAPILLGILGIFRIFPEINFFMAPLGLGSILGIFSSFSPWLPQINDYGAGGSMSFIPVLLAMALAGIAVVATTVWICVLLYRRKYSQAWTWLLGVGLGSFAGTMIEVVIFSRLGEGLVFPLFSFTFAGVAAISPLSIPAFVIAWAVGRSTNPTTPRPMNQGYAPNVGATGYQHSPQPSQAAWTAAPYTSAYPAPAPHATPQPNPTTGENPMSTPVTPPPPANTPLTTTAAAATQAAYGSAPAPGTNPFVTPLPKRPTRVAGPSQAFNLTMLGLILLAIFATGLARYYQVFPYPEQYWLLGAGLVTVIMGVGMLALTLRRRRTSWLAVTTPLLVVLVLLPSLGAAEVAPEVRQFTKNWNWQTFTRALDDGEHHLEPGDAQQSVSGDFSIDLRGKALGAPIEAQTVSGNTNIYVNPDQPVRITLQQVGGEIRLSAMKQWTEPGSQTKRRSFLKNARTDSGRPQYLSADGTRRVLFTDRALQLESQAVVHWWPSRSDKRRQGHTYTLENAAAQGKTKVQEVTVACVECIVSIYERPSEVLWNGTVLPDGHFSVNYWLDEHSNRREFDSDMAALPVQLARRVADPEARLAGVAVKEVAASWESDKPITLTEVQNGALGSWEDKNNDGFNDLYQPGGSAWKPGDTLFDPQTGQPRPYLVQSSGHDG